MTSVGLLLDNTIGFKLGEINEVIKGVEAGLTLDPCGEMLLLDVANGVWLGGNVGVMETSDDRIIEGDALGHCDGLLLLESTIGIKVGLCDGFVDGIVLMHLDGTLRHDEGPTVGTVLAGYKEGREVELTCGLLEGISFGI